MLFDPAGNIDQQCKTGRMAFRKTIFAKAFDLFEDALSKIALITAFQHAAQNAFIETGDAAFALPRRHRTAQCIGLTGREASRQNRDLHDLLLKDRYAQRARQCRFYFFTRVFNRLQPLAAAQVGMHHAALNRSWPNDGDLNH